MPCPLVLHSISNFILCHILFCFLAKLTSELWVVCSPPPYTQLIVYQSKQVYDIRYPLNLMGRQSKSISFENFFTYPEQLQKSSCCLIGWLVCQLVCQSTTFVIYDIFTSWITFMTFLQSKALSTRSYECLIILCKTLPVRCFCLCLCLFLCLCPQSL